jgi:hypothetical protein
MPGWWYFVPSLMGAVLWPAAHVLLTIPLRPRRDPDDV